MMHTCFLRALMVSCLVLVGACADNASVVGGPVDAAPDVVADDLAPTPDVVDVVDAIDVVDVLDVVDAPEAAFRCAADGDCAGNAAGPTCDVASGRCVPCLASRDTCPAGQYCNAGACARGCHDDDGCAPAVTGDAGGDPVSHCDVTTHACVACVTDAHCPSGMLCTGNVCVMGCTAARPCPGSQVCCTGACVDTQSNTAACGACDARCTVAHAAAACMNGHCAVGACTEPYADCDRDAANGCEVDTTTAVAHCGGCGMACAARAHSAATCAAGRCQYACDAGFADCDGEPANGCEVDTRVSGDHCGGCGRACRPPSAEGACVMGACTVARCNDGTGDCDGNPANGCEVNTRATTDHCGMCGHACPRGANTLPGCLDGACVSACLAGFADCDDDLANGCEVNTRTSMANCGACGARCELAHATATCTAGLCALTTCDAGFADCDMARANGCEVDTSTSVTHCGMCGRACPAPAHATATCATGTCGYVCVPGYGDCDGNVANGCETDLSSDAANCGRCGGACASRVCRGGACQTATCGDGVANGGESDTDCGGPTCTRCDLCRACSSGSDCLSGTCSGAGRCTFRTDVTIRGSTRVTAPEGPRAMSPSRAFPRAATTSPRSSPPASCGAPSRCRGRGGSGTSPARTSRCPSSRRRRGRTTPPRPTRSARCRVRRHG